MRSRLFCQASLIGLAVALGSATTAAAEAVRVMRGAPSSALQVPMNRAVVVESDTPFAELSIANPGIADISTLSERSIYVLGKTPGRTTLTLLSGDGRLISNIDVHVTPDIAEFKERLRQILPGENIEVRTANDGIVLSGVVSSTVRMDRALDLAERYAPRRVSNLMSVGGTQQVMLKVRFAEMQRSVSKNLSASLGVRSTSNTVGGVIGTGNFTGTGAINNAFNGGTFPIRPDSSGAMGLGFSAGSLQFAVLLEALEAKGVVRTLAEPNLTALSGQEAKFLAGGEYPIPVLNDDGISISYKPFGVELNFTPRVVDGDIINLVINAAVSAIDASVTVQNAGFAVNAFKRRETSTTVELRDGESFAIAGLLQDDFRNLKGQVPWLGDIPVLGALFRSADYERAQTELVIIVTPHLVTPTRGEALALPTDRVRLPTEREFFLFGKVAGDKAPRGAAGEVARQDFTSPYGYVME
ncbi:MAG: type II and III secretion system protein family protein [Gemmobacter sp.]